MPSKKSIVITGGSGFIGSHLVRSLASEGHSLKVFSRRKNPKTLISIEGDIEIIQFDFKSDLNLLSSVLENCDLVYHIAWSNLPRSGNDDYLINDIMGSVLDTIELLKSCVKHGVNKFVFTSSGGAIYGDNPTAIDEDTTTFPISSYGLTKLIVEKYLHYFSVHYDLTYAIVRIANAYGPRDPDYIRQGIISTWLSRHIQGKQVQLYGDGSQIRDYIYVEDIAECLNLLGKSQLRNEAYNLSSGIGLSILEIKALIEQEIGGPLDMEHISYDKNDVKVNILNNSKIKGVLDWAPKWTISEGIKSTYQHYKANLTS